MLKNPQATAIFMGFQNMMHDIMHAGKLTPGEVVQYLFVAAKDAEDIMAGRGAEVRGHGDEKAYLTLDSEQGKYADQIITDMWQSAAASVVDPSLPKPTVETPQGSLN